MIKKINDFTYKSFNHFTGPSDDFRKINIIFGYNGSGKSSLVGGIIDEFLKNAIYNNNNVRVYSSDYTNKYLLLDPMNRRNIRGIKAVFGEKNVLVENMIKDFEKQLVSEKEIELLENEIIQFEDRTKKEISKILNEKKGNLRLQNKATSLSLMDTIQSYKDDLRSALKVEPDVDKIEKTRGDDTIEKKIVSLSSLDLFLTTFFESVNFDELSKLQEQIFDNIAIPSSTIISWLSQGLTIHVGKNHCEFCGSSIVFDSIKSKVDSYTNNRKFEAESFFKDHFLQLNEKLSKLSQLMQKKESYLNQIGEIAEIFNKLEFEVNKFDDFLKLLKYNFEHILDINKINIDELKKCCLSIDELGRRINTAIKTNIENEQKKAEKISLLIKGAVSIAISKSTAINNNLASINKNTKLLIEYQKSNKRINEQLKRLKESKIITADFKDLVNVILRDLNISLELEIDGNDYFIKTTLLDKRELTIDDISEGEKNILSLVFFYFEMFEDKMQTRLKNDIKLIVLDDPISSMDDSNRLYVIEIVKNIINLDVEQVFVLTHVWDDYCQLIYGRSCFAVDSKHASYEIRKEKDSQIFRNDSRGNPYKFMFKEIYDLSLKTSLNTDCDYFHIPNTIRKVFEEFLNFKTNKTALAQGGKINEIASLFEINSPSDKAKLGTLLSVGNVLSHVNTKTNEDILLAAKFLMKIIEKNDKIHFDSMKH